MGNISKKNAGPGNTSQPSGDAEHDASPTTDTRTGSASGTGSASRTDNAGINRRKLPGTGKPAEPKAKAQTAISFGPDEKVTEPAKPATDSQRAFSEAVTPPERPKTRGRKAKTAIKPTPDQAAEAVRGIVEVVQLFAVTRFGPEGMFTPTELALIEPSLVRLVERYGSVASQFSFLLDPLLVAAGVAMYAYRLAPHISKQAGDQPGDQPGGTPPDKQPDQPPGDNGAVRMLSPDQVWDYAGGAHNR